MVHTPFAEHPGKTVRARGRFDQGDRSHRRPFGGPSALHRMLRCLTALEQALASEAAPHHRRADDDCGCGHHRTGLHCGSHDCCGWDDDCSCTCCLGDVDLAIYSRVGERRVVPIVIENPRRRGRRLHLELSSWTSRTQGEQARVSSSLNPTDLDLGPCAEATVILQVTTEPAAGDQQQPGPDLDLCATYVADLRVEGCDLRPVRLALALLPRHCADYTLECGCGCC